MRQNDELRRNTPRLREAYDEDEDEDGNTQPVGHRGGEEETLDYYEGDLFEDTDWDDAWADAYDDVDDEEEDDYEGETA